MSDAQNPYDPPSTSEPVPSARVSIPSHGAQGQRLCPFCGVEAPDARCPGCGRDPTAPRVVCPSCRGQTPAAEPVCCHCRRPRRRELRWKIPLIIALFVLAVVVSVAARLIR